MASIILSKTKYLNGLQCPRYLWILCNDSKRVPETDLNTQYIFDQGHVVGELAKKLFSDGINVPQDSFTGNINKTKELLIERKPLFEAGILAGNLYARIDVLNPVDDKSWDIIEIKSSTNVKDIHIDDMSFQKYCCEKKGLKIRKCFLVCINNQYVKEGEIDPDKLFNMQDITSEVELIIKNIRERINIMLDVIELENCPNINIGKHCRDPYDCPITECWELLPNGNIFDLYRGGAKRFELFNEGVLAIKDIPVNYQLTAAQQIQKNCETTNQTHIDNAGISNFLSTLQYPCYYLDFETFSPAVPMFDGTRPYQPIPFQFSLHVVSDEKANPEHFSFLANGNDDPRPVFLTKLKERLGNTGSIIVYNKGFEESILKELGMAHSEHVSWVAQICSRLVDLLEPFRKFHYYNPLQQGSASLKSVLPALTGKGYQGLDIAGGIEASIAFLAVTYTDVTEEENKRVRSDLEKYCALDTEGMIWIVDKLKELIG